MKPRELALRYMASFFGETPLTDMRSLLAEDFTFRGPFYEFDSAQAYIEALVSDPPRDARYQLLEIYENEHSVCLIYQFTKPGVQTTMVQIFETRGEKITRIRLIFNPIAFK